jgi:adenylosuccinate lyase
VLRNLGVGVGHTSVALQSIARGLAKLEVDRERLAEDLDRNWEVLAEAIQTVMRRHGVDRPYERLKELTRGRQVGRPELERFVDGLDIPAEAKARLKSLTPAGYTGAAARQARGV